MQTFTPKELWYLYKLRERNISNDPKNQTEPLNKPMNVEERKLRSRIRKKCKNYTYELALAEFCGLIPDKEMKKAKMNNIHQAFEEASWRIVFQGNKRKLNTIDT